MARSPKMAASNGSSDEAELREPDHGIIYRCAKMAEVIEQIGLAAQVDSNVLILGETGTGKELVARAIHDRSARASGPYLAWNISATAESLLESELLGHVKGAFTGAVKDRPGHLVEMSGGTVFLDETGDAPRSLQVRLLRVTEYRRVLPVGSSVEVPFDTRLIFATNRDLKAMIRRGDFRADLYFRIASFVISLPPLRERDEDVPLLLNYFLDRFATEFGLAAPPVVTDEVLSHLSTYPWPGNVRELRSVAENLVMFRGAEEIRLSDARRAIERAPYREIATPPHGEGMVEGEISGRQTDPAQSPEIPLHLQGEWRRYQSHKELIERVGSISEAARLLKIDRRTLQRWMKRWVENGWE